MEVFIVIIVLAVLAAIILPIIFVARKKNKTPKQLGQQGEEWVISILGEDVPNEKYTINNLTIVSDGKSSQIDHIVITKVGIFLIETKNYSGRIYGRLNQRQWTQVLANGKVKNSFYNPTMQSNTHMYRLKRVLGNFAKNDCFIQIVVFPKAELMIEPIANVGDMQNLIRIYNTPRQLIFSIDEINGIYNKLIELKNNPQVSDEEHIQNICKTQQDIAYNICPRCRKELVLRNGQFGSFYGCKGYPYCKFKKQV